MRRCVACLLLVLFCGGAAAQTADTSLVSLPDYFQKSFDGAAAKPLKPFVPKPKLFIANHFPDVFFPGIDRGQFVKVRAHLIRIDPRKRRLAAARRSPQQERKKLFFLDRDAKRFSLADQMFLSDEFIESRRSDF